MIQSKVLIAGAPLGVIAAFTVVSQPVHAGTCAIVSVKARGLTQAAAANRAQKKLTRHINHWAHMNKLKIVHVGHGPAGCSKGALAVCTATAKVCP
jgi:hypothetical protein